MQPKAEEKGTKLPILNGLDFHMINLVLLNGLRPTSLSQKVG